MAKERPNLPKDYYNEASEVLGEDFWQEIGQLIPVTGPRIDMYHTPTSIVVLAELPAIRSQEQIEIRLEGQTLLLEGEIPFPYPVTENRMLLKERYFGPFKRALTLPKPVAAAGISAKYAKGLLIVELPIEASETPTSIPIQDESGPGANGA